MRTSINIPDVLLLAAKRKALEEGRTVTEIVVEGLRGRIEKPLPARDLPVSAASGGLRPGVDWMRLRGAGDADEEYR